MKAKSLVSLAIIALATGSTACSSNDDESPETPGDTTPDPDVKEYQAGLTVEDTQAVFKTADYELEPGQEKFLCYAVDVEDDLVLDTLSHSGSPTLHHVIFSKTAVREPDGYSECDTLFRVTWEPVYLAGAGSSSLELPEGYAHKVKGGTQLLAQLHLLNASDEVVHDNVEITMKRSPLASPKPVSVFAFGNTNVNLPPKQASELEGNCTLKEDVWLLNAFPHMHLLGTAMTFDVAHAGGDFERKFDRTPFDFDDQSLDPLDLHLSAGDQTKVTCSYENTHDQTITFGESTRSEMCFFVAFAADRDTISGCMQSK